MLSGKLQTGLDMSWLKQGDTAGTAGFESLLVWCYFGSLCYFGPSSLQVMVPPCSSGIFAHRSHDHFDPNLGSRSGALAWSPRLREIISGLVCLPFSYNCSHS